MRVLQCIAALALSATVAACGGSRVQNLANKCAAYGYQPGTLEFSQCIEREDERGRQATGAALGTTQRQQQLQSAALPAAPTLAAALDDPLPNLRA